MTKEEEESGQRLEGLPKIRVPTHTVGVKVEVVLVCLDQKLPGENQPWVKKQGRKENTAINLLSRGENSI